MHSFVTLAEQLLLKNKWNKPTLTSRQNSLTDPFPFLISSNISLSLIGLASWQILFYKITSCVYHSHIHTEKRGWREIHLCWLALTTTTKGWIFFFLFGSNYFTLFLLHRGTTWIPSFTNFKRILHFLCLDHR